MMRKITALLLVVSLVISLAIIPVSAETIPSSAPLASVTDVSDFNLLSNESPAEISSEPSSEVSPSPSPEAPPSPSPEAPPSPSPEAPPSPSPEVPPSPSPEAPPEPSEDPSPEGGVALRTDHASYISGVSEGYFKPERSLTWAEICTILYRLLEDQSMGEHPYTFADVSSSQWYYTAISVLASRGILPCDGGKLYPNSPISRGDFVQLLSALVPADEDAVCDFPDVPESDPRYSAIAAAFTRGWISGFSDGTFRPNSTLTRAQAVTVLNRVLGRSMDPDVRDNDKYVTPFKDVASSAWFYSAVLEAAVPHTPFEKDDGSEGWSDYQNTYPVTFRYSGTVATYMIPQGGVISEVPTTSVNYWVDQTGAQVNPVGLVVEQPMSFSAFIIPALVKDHVQYVNGYSDGTFRPEKNVTRAEADTLLYGLLKVKFIGSFPYQYDDVSKGSWYYDAVSSITSLGFFSAGGSFRPNEPITRGEFVMMISHLSNSAPGTSSFTDVNPEDPFYDAVLICTGKDWINGYDDGTFRPENPLTRAQAVAVFNRILNRTGDSATINKMDNRYTFTDLKSSHWAFLQIMEASVTHKYSKSGSSEAWSLYYHENVGWPNWESSDSVVNAAKITTSITGVYAGDYTMVHNIDYSTAAKEQFVNGRGYSSSTGYLIWVSRQTQKTYIFTGSKGNWKLARNCICATGAASTPTPAGVTYTTFKQNGWYTSSYICRPIVRFYPNSGYAFHSRLYYPNDETKLMKPDLGYPMSHGCIRMLDPDINYIYYSIPLRTTVVIY